MPASAVAERQAPQKALYNLGVAVLEVGAAAFAVGLVARRTRLIRPCGSRCTPGCIAGDVARAPRAERLWRLLRIPVDLRQRAACRWCPAPRVTLLFTGLAIVAISAVQVEPLTHW